MTKGQILEEKKRQSNSSTILNLFLTQKRGSQKKPV